MQTTRKILEALGGNLEESMGQRKFDRKPILSPVPQNKDAGRRPIKNIGKLDIDKVIPDPEQPRVEFSEDAIERLANSIKERGQLSPIRVRWSDDLDKWVIISGERRWRATKKADLPTIDCCFNDGELDEIPSVGTTTYRKLSARGFAADGTGTCLPPH